MATLKDGSSGLEVESLQRRLLALGLNPGVIDGDFGPAMTAALIAFQLSRDMLADGAAGPRTLAALGLAEDDNLPSAIPGLTVTIASRMFPNTPVGNIRPNLPHLAGRLAVRPVRPPDRPIAGRLMARCSRAVASSSSRVATTTRGTAPRSASATSWSPTPRARTIR